MKSKIISAERGLHRVRGLITPLSFFFCFSEDVLGVVEEVESKFYLLQNIYERRYRIIYKDWRIKGTLYAKNVQSVYNKIILTCNYAIFIFEDEIRDGTKKEFEMVYNHLLNNGRKPKILLYIKKGKNTEALREYFKPYSKHITYILFDNSSQIFNDIELKVSSLYFNESIRYSYVKVASRSELINKRLQILQQEYKSIFANYPEKITRIENAIIKTKCKMNENLIIDIKNHPMNVVEKTTIKSAYTI